MIPENERTGEAGIKTGLKEFRPSQCHPLSQEELKELSELSKNSFSKGWRVDVPVDSLRITGVDHFILAIDKHFPNSQPRVFAPGAGSDYRWPHVEKGGLLCLPSSSCQALVADRIIYHLRNAEKLLNYSEAECQKEFEREFASYWVNCSEPESRDEGIDKVAVLSLVTPRGVEREICYCYFCDSKRNWLIFGNERATLKDWLINFGYNPGEKEIIPTWLFRLSRPWLPKDFPKYGRDVIDLLSPGKAQKYLLPKNQRSPFLFETETTTGTVFAAVVLSGAKQQELLKGFRKISRVPSERIINSYARRHIKRYEVTRVDGAWIHGRDHSSNFAGVKNRKVAIVGCGAIGAAVAHLLAQAGVGEIVLVDGDNLSAANISRHQLGIEYVGSNKASSLQKELRKQFPHLKFNQAFPFYFERLPSKAREHLEQADLIVSAGINFDGEAVLDKWRRSLSQPPAHLSTWIEAYGVAGHAVLLYGKRSILEGFEREQPKFRLTDWSEEAGALITEAGCGNSFQPYGVIDLHPTIALAAGLALGVLLDKIRSSCRRVWMGDPLDVKRNGGTLRGGFTDTQTIREFPWE